MTFRELADTLESVARARGKLTRTEYADFLEQTANRLLAESEKIRNSAAPAEQSKGGWGDQVKMQVIGPNGQVKQEIERN